MLFEKFLPEPDVLEALPIFPLPNIVLFPGMVLPLNVFEPRYLALVDHIRGASPYFGVPMLADDRGHDPLRPCIEPVFGLGRLHQHQTLADGRRLIQVLGVGRVRQLREVESSPFRAVDVEILNEDYPSDGHLVAIFRAQVERLGRACAREQAEVLDMLLSIDDDRVFLYTIAALLPTAQVLVAATVGGHPKLRRYAPLQQACLVADNPNFRCELLIDEVSRLLLQVREASRIPSQLLN